VQPYFSSSAARSRYRLRCFGFSEIPMAPGQCKRRAQNGTGAGAGAVAGAGAGAGTGAGPEPGPEPVRNRGRECGVCKSNCVVRPYTSEDRSVAARPALMTEKRAARAGSVVTAQEARDERRWATGRAGQPAVDERVSVDWAAVYRSSFTDLVRYLYRKVWDAERAQ